MGSKPSVSRASPPPSEPRSPPTASVLAKETRDGARGLSGVLACIPPSEAAGPLRKRLRSALPEDGGDAKRIKDVGNGVVPDTALLDDDGPFHLASEVPESLLFSCQPLGAASDMVLDPIGSSHGVQPVSSFKLDGAKHKIFLSHAGAQKDFVEQLCVDLERMGYFFPFFDQRHHSLPKAVRALCKSNGLDFGKVARKEVAYRKCVVESIFKLSPPDLLFGSSESMVGSARMCETMSREFVEDTIVGARVLGVYGMAGLGKTMLAKALHDYFYAEFLGRVCYVDMHHGSRAQRLKWMLKMLCGFEEDVVDCIGANVGKGLMQMKTFLKRERVFLVIDNINCDEHLLREVQDYLRMGFHPESRIMITSSSKAILEDLLPNLEFFTPMPTLRVEEAGALFLHRAAPMKAISELTREEQNILGICIRKCWFDSPDGGFYHPVALTALADFFSRFGRAKGNQLLVWKDHLEKEMNLVKDVLKSSKDLFGILGLQFSTFDFGEKLLFLDVALYIRDFGVDWGFFGGQFGWLCRLHDESPTIIIKKLLDLRKSGMIDFNFLNRMDYEGKYNITVPSLYMEFAEWYAMDHKVNGLKNAWGVFQLGGMNLRGDSSTTIKKWSKLIRLRISSMTLVDARLVASKRMQELKNLVVLQLSYCDDLTTLNLQGLDCLRDLGLWHLQKLETITISGNSSIDEYAGIYDSLQHVQLCSLGSLVHMPDLRPCTSLHLVVVEDCSSVRNLEGVDCPYMKALILMDLSPNHFEKILHFNCLQSLEELQIDAESEVGFATQWEQRANESDVGLQVALEGEGPCAKLLKKLCPLLYGSNNKICRYFEWYWVVDFDGEEESHEDYEDDFFVSLINDILL